MLTIDQLDSVFSKYVRLIHSDMDGYCHCFTCAKRLHWKDIHNGHFISRQIKAVRFDEGNCKPQCMECNVFLHGMEHEFKKRLEMLYGVEHLAELKRKSKLPFTAPDQVTITYWQTCIDAKLTLLTHRDNDWRKPVIF